MCTIERLDQVCDNWHTNSRAKIKPRTCVINSIGSVTTRGNIAEIGCSGQRIDLGPKQAKRTCPEISPPLINPGANSCPGGCAPTRATDRVQLTVKNEIAASVE